MKQQFSLFVLLALASCGKAGKIVEIPAEQDLNALRQPQVRPFEGQVLTIKDKENAHIAILNYDAEVLYGALQLHEEALDDGRTFSKQGKFIWCGKTIPKTEAEKAFFSCTVYLNPVSGILFPNSQTPKEDKALPDLAEDYIGNVLAVYPRSQQFNIGFIGEDARKLFEALNFEPVVIENNDIKMKSKGISPLLSCIESFSKKSLQYSYGCSFDLKITDGTFAQAPSWELNLKEKEKLAAEKEKAEEKENETEKENEKEEETKDTQIEPEAPEQD